MWANSTDSPMAAARSSASVGPASARRSSATMSRLGVSGLSHSRAGLAGILSQGSVRQPEQQPPRARRLRRAVRRRAGGCPSAEVQPRARPGAPALRRRTRPCERPVPPESHRPTAGPGRTARATAARLPRAVRRGAPSLGARSRRGVADQFRRPWWWQQPVHGRGQVRLTPRRVTPPQG